MGREKVGDTGKGKKEKGGLKKFEVGTKGYFEYEFFFFNMKL